MRQIVTLLFLLAIQTCLLGQEKKDLSENPLPVVIPGTQQLYLTSSIVPGQEYVLQVNLPRNYKDSTKTFPVIYLLDSQWDFPLLSAIIGEQYFDGFVPEVIVVGITWGGSEPKYDELRRRDFTPSSAGQPDKNGNAAKFLSCITKEIAPLIEKKYHVNKEQRTLMGSSLGGLFTLYSMFHETAFFKNYLMTSAYTPWDKEIIYKIENEFSSRNKALEARLFMATGDLEDVAAFDKFANTLRGRNYEGLKMQTKVLENTGHSGTKPEGYTRGMQWAFKRPVVALSPAQLKPFLGAYVAGKDTIRITLGKDGLVALAQNGKVKLTSCGPQDFYEPGKFLFLHFKKDKQEKISGFQSEFYGGEIFARKLE